VSGFSARVAHSTIEADISALRWYSALRRAAVVIGILVLGSAAFGVSSGVNAATSALLIGLLDKGLSPRATWRTMAAATVFLCLITMFASFASELAGSWVVKVSDQVLNPVMIIALVLLAFCAGVSPAVDPRATAILIYGAVTIAFHLTSPLKVEQIWGVTALVFVAGGLQTIFALLATPVIGDLPERRRLAAAMRAVAAQCAAVGRGDPSDLSYGVTASKQLGSAEDTIRKGDLATNRRARYSILLANVDIIRLEARAYSTRTHLGLPRPPNHTTAMVFHQVSEILTISSALFLKPRSEQIVTDLNEKVHRLRDAYRGRSTTKIAAATLEATYALPKDLSEIVDDHYVRREHQQPSRTLRRRLATALSPGSMSLKYGLRMATGVVVAQGIAIALQLPYSYWVAITAMMLLRPDGGPTAPRILMQALGVTVAVGAMIGVLAVVQMFPHPQVALQVIITVAVIGTYAVVAVNYSAQTALTTMSLVLILSLSYTNGQVDLVKQRWTDVLIGCVIGTVFAFAWPLWERVSLTSDTASYADAVSAWLATVSLAAATSPEERGEVMDKMRRASSQARDLRQVVDTTFNTALLEPPSMHADAASVGVVMTWIRRSSDAAVTAESMLRHQAPGSELAVALADAAAQDLRKTAEVLRTGSRDHKIPEDLLTTATSTRRTIDNPDDRVTSVLARSELSAGAALRASYRVGTGRPEVESGARQGSDYIA
jgi:hypothetical protein